MKIIAQKGYILTEQERLELARLLIKAGHVVRVGKEKPEGKTSGYIHFVEYNVPGKVSGP